MSQSNKQRALVICPGRGTYNKEELGYFARHHQDKQSLIDTIDTQRNVRGQTSIAELDNANAYNLKAHTAGENASSLIYACAHGDFLDINRDEYDIVAVTGNSMGWYIACAVAGALSHEDGSHLINTMGSMMTDGIIGGQMIYPIVDENWRIDDAQKQLVSEAIHKISQESECEVYESIRLGGYAVIGGNEKALKRIKAVLPEIDARYPMRLFNHAAFHTPLLDTIVTKAKKVLPATMFGAPELPMIDGEGQIWQPFSADTHSLYDYTLGTQVNSVYDFTQAITVGIKEFAPDKLIILGPGATLGGAVAQILIQHQWFGLHAKADFIERQKTDPVIISMGMEGQRNWAIDGIK